MFCNKCGKENNIESEFCSQCGNKLMKNDVEKSINYDIDRNNIKKKIIKIWSIAFIILFIIAHIIFQIKLHNVDKELQKEAEHINDSLNNELDSNTNQNKTYNIGDKITLVDGSNWYVLKQEGMNLTLLSAENYGETTYFSASSNYYENSIVKDKIENEYLPNLKNSILASNGDITNLKARIISIDEIRSILNVSSTVENTKIEINNSYKWLYETGNYWTSTHSNDSSYESVYIVENWATFGVISEDVAGLGLSSGNKFYIRPVIETVVSNVK